MSEGENKVKKFLKLVAVLLVVTILCGCGIKSEEEKIIKCQNIADELGVTLRVRPFEE